MALENYDRLLALLLGPLGLVVLAALVLSATLPRPRRFFWLVFATAAFAATLGKPPAHQNPPPLAFPLEQLVTIGRPLTVALLGLLLVLGFRVRRSWRHDFAPPAIAGLLLVQAAVFLKTLGFGSISFAFFSLATFGLVLTVALVISRFWIQGDADFVYAAWAMAMVPVLFLLVNGYQLLRDPAAASTVNAWFHGTTGNSNSASLFLVTGVPAILFLIDVRGSTLRRALWVGVLALVSIAIFFTASRTGGAMGIAALTLFYRRRALRVLPAAAVAAAVIAAILPWIRGASDLGERSYQAVVGKYVAGGNTRAPVWTDLWNTFVANPWTGAPLQGDRLGFGESSWLAAAATLGVTGLIPLLLFAYLAIRLLVQVRGVGRRRPEYAPYAALVIAGIGSSLVGSLSEAFLLGNLTFPLMALLLNLALGSYLLEADTVAAPDRQATGRKVRPDRAGGRRLVATASGGGGGW